MKINNYIREKHGAINVIHSLQGYSLMVDTRKELLPEDWDAAVARCYQKGWELTSDEPDTIAGVWEFYFLSRIQDAA